MKISRRLLFVWLTIVVLLVCAVSIYLAYPGKSDFIFDLLMAAGIAGGLEYGVQLIGRKLLKTRKERNPLLE